ncbi:MAG TPA: DUF4845 domain-containing protein, partial [Azospira sp.]|nr:DUF4845 domain-containing protein [Azospira sp.]
VNKQKGVSLSALLVWCFIIAMVSLLTMKVAPSIIEYYKIRKSIQSVVQNAGPNATVPDLRKAYDRYAEIDHVSDIRSEDLDISKDGSQIVISFAYEKKIGLVGPVSLLIEYQASTAK